MKHSNVCRGVNIRRFIRLHDVRTAQTCESEGHKARDIPHALVEHAMTDLPSLLARDPQAFVTCDYAEGFALSAKERDEAQLEAARQRFAALAQRIAPLGRMAAENG